MNPDPDSERLTGTDRNMPRKPSENNPSRGQDSLAPAHGSDAGVKCNWTIEYEIPPLRAIYFACADNCTEAEARDLVRIEQPLWSIRKMMRQNRCGSATGPTTQDVTMPNDSKTESAQPGSLHPAGSVTLTYAELEALLQNCRWGIESAPGEDPPDGYEALPPEQAEIADACWHSGMEQLSTALLNYWYDHGAAPVSPNSGVGE